MIYSLSYLYLIKNIKNFPSNVEKRDELCYNVKNYTISFYNRSVSLWQDFLRISKLHKTQSFSL